MHSEFNSQNFMCGVVEGFYGRPWTTGQRKELFRRMRDLGMNTYLYAPKDDLKHRQYWREMYSVEEAEEMKSLIEAAKQFNVTFIYAISPGLDMAFSSIKEASILKRKIDQVVQLGCTSFALLFDDIDPQLCAADKEVFQSFGHAQAALTNEIYQHLVKPPNFLFCPTEYCATRAQPNVLKSDYLNTIGTKLMSGIDIMWTGPKVIAKRISSESIQELGSVLRRPPLIWDNIHANDYDQKRLFLGPYAGRSVDIIPGIRGVLTNPNCEFEANFIAFHTLAQWSRSNSDSIQQQAMLNSSPVRSDVKLETEEESEHDMDPDKRDTNLSDDNSSRGNPNCYHPRRALHSALIDWLKIMRQEKKISSKSQKIRNRKSVAKAVIANAVGSLPPSFVADVAEVCQSMGGDAGVVNAAAAGALDGIARSHAVSTPASSESGSAVSAPNCNLPTSPVMSRTSVEGCSNTSTVAVAAVVSAVALEEVQVNNGSMQDFSAIDPSLQLTAHEIVPTIAPLTNYITSAVESIASHPIPTPMETEFMDDADEGLGMQVDPQSSHQGSMTDIPLNKSGRHTDEEAILSDDSEDIDLEEGEVGEHSDVDEDELTVKDLAFMVDLFYLPYEHGRQAVRCLELFNWLRVNAHLVSESNDTLDGAPSKESQHWREKATEFDHDVKRVSNLCHKLTRLPNRDLVCDIYPYVQDIRSILGILNSYCKWLGVGQVPYLSVCYLRRLLTWCTPGYHEMFTSDDHEPWMFRGGLAAEFQRMLPLEGSQDLFPIRSFTSPSALSDVISTASMANPAEVSTFTGAGATSAGGKSSSSNATPMHTFVVRPYFPSDRSALYELCRETFLKRAIMNGWLVEQDIDVFNNLTSHAKDLPGDRYIGCFLQHSPEYCFVLEDDSGKLVGYSLAALDHYRMSSLLDSTYLSVMRLKYGEEKVFQIDQTAVSLGQQPSFLLDESQLAQSAERCRKLVQNMIADFSTLMVDLTPCNPEEAQETLPLKSTSSDVSLNSASETPFEKQPCCFCFRWRSADEKPPPCSYPSALYFDILAVTAMGSTFDDVLRRLLACSFAALRTNGSQGVQSTLERGNHSLLELYKRFGFVEVRPGNDRFIHVGRII